MSCGRRLRRLLGGICSCQGGGRVSNAGLVGEEKIEICWHRRRLIGARNRRRRLRPLRGPNLRLRTASEVPEGLRLDQGVARLRGSVAVFFGFDVIILVVMVQGLPLVAG